MKMMVKLAVLFATLLLLTGAAFAQSFNCNCYEVTLTDLDGSPDTWTEFVEICFDDDNVGHTDLCGESELYMFFDSMREQALTYHSNAGVCVAYLKFHGDDQYVVTGIVFGEGRATFRGHKTDEISKCED
jgi:hypothetical protein